MADKLRNANVLSTIATRRLAMIIGWFSSSFELKNPKMSYLGTQLLVHLLHGSFCMFFVVCLARFCISDGLERRQKTSSSEEVF